MRKNFIYLAIAAIALSGCAKESQISVTAPQDGKAIRTITASIPETKTSVEINDQKEGIYSWTENEKIAVCVVNGNVEEFQVADLTKGTFQSVNAIDETAALSFAVSPASALDANSSADDTDVIFKIKLSGEYDSADGTNAVMLAGAPEQGTDGNEKFTFRHVAGLMKVTYQNVPVGTYGLRYTTDKPIVGDFNFESLDGVELTQPETGDKTAKVWILNGVTSPNTTVEFYVPVPTGNYGSFEVALFDENEADIEGTVRSMTANFTVNKADIVRIPTIKLALAEEDVTVNNYQLVTSGSLTDGDYLIAYVDGTIAKVYTGVDENINHSDYQVVNDAISASAALDNLAIEVKAVTGGYTLKVKNGTNAGKYIGSASGNNNGTSFSNNEIVNSIEIDANGIAEVTDNNNSNTHLVFNSASNTERFRYYKTTTTGGIVSISFFKKVSQSGKKLNTPTDLKVEGKVVSWNPVNNADQYAITIGSISETVNACTYTFTGNDDYYDVSVVAQASDDSRFASNAATLSNAKFGSPTLATPNLKKGAIGENSLTVTWTVDDRAAAGYTCEIKDAGEYSKSTTVEEGSVTFDGLNDETEYTITVVANKVTSPLEYEASEPAIIKITTAVKTTIKSILDGTDTAAKSLSGVTVLAVSSQGVYVGDSTGWIFAQQSSTNPNDLTIGEVVNVSGTAGSQNSQRVLKTSTIERASGTAISIPAAEDITYEGLSSLASSFERKRISFSGEVATVNSTSGYYNIKLEGKTDIQIALYRPVSTITSSIKVGQTVIMSGYTMHVTGSSIKYLYITADAFAIVNISVKPSPAQYKFAWDESGTENKQEFEIESDDNNWTIDDSEISSWATVSKSGNKVVVYPTENNVSGNDYTGKIYVIHAKVSTLKAEISVEQEKYVDPSQTSDHSATIKFGSASGSTNVNSGTVTGNDSQSNTWTVTTEGTTSFTPKAAYAQIGSSKAPATSITFTTTLEKDATIKAMSAKFGGFSGTAGTVTLKVGETTIGTGSLNAADDVTVSATTTTASGKVLTVTITGISKGVKAYEINVTYNN